ncbi:hypothetical protein CBER1_11944 [Cercospora berteroae]|uniref:Uncharacterized protein n=1 Tax=Cercospora berteroae TaxID=357750 RepID=A0A2S6C0I2_9PEZI|nr:hypothetical protein CBER1_11944 [Cercospora berteroae]
MQVALYEAKPDELPTQVERITRAANGDLDARLELILAKDAEAVLSIAARPDHPAENILAYLTNRGEGRTPAHALKDVLDPPADKTEDVAVLTSFVWRYARGIASGRPIPTRRCARKSPVTWSRTSSRLVPSLDETIATWTKSVEARTDEGLRRQRRTRLPTKQHIISHDVESLVHGKKAEEYGRRVVETHMPGLNEDRLELRPLHQPAPAPAQTAPAPKAKRKRTGGAGASSKRVKKGPGVAKDAMDDPD